MKILHNTSLKDYNTFGIDVKARNFISVDTLEELKQVLRQNYGEDLFLLGGGSNMLLTKDVESTVLHINLHGRKILRETETEVIVEAKAGENWHQFVLYTLDQDFGGLENLSLIPGNVGTAPIQNIGAYGVELKDTFVSCTALDLQTLEEKLFSAEDVNFGYRNSIFKTIAKGKYVITSVTFKLSKHSHSLHTNYGSINEALLEKGITTPNIRDISNAVIYIRQQKLPDPRVLGNSGSFFKNPEIDEKQLKDLQVEFPQIPYYPVSTGFVKIPAGWLIDRAGLKGYREGDAGVHKDQALVLVNYGLAEGKEILNLAVKVQERIKTIFKIDLEPEVNIF